MRTYKLISFLALMLSAASPQSGNKDDVDPFNIPDELKTCLKAEPELQAHGEINPFYISADYDGDGFTDFAVQVRTKKDERHGLLVCFANGKTSHHRCRDTYAVATVERRPR